MLFVERVDVGRVQVTFVKSLGTSSQATVYFVGSLSGKCWNLNEKQVDLMNIKFMFVYRPNSYIHLEIREGEHRFYWY